MVTPANTDELLVAVSLWYQQIPLSKQSQTQMKCWLLCRFDIGTSLINNLLRLYTWFMVTACVTVFEEWITSWTSEWIFGLILFDTRLRGYRTQSRISCSRGRRDDVVNVINASRTSDSKQVDPGFTSLPTLKHTPTGSACVNIITSTMCVSSLPCSQHALIFVNIKFIQPAQTELVIEYTEWANGSTSTTPSPTSHYLCTHWLGSVTSESAHCFVQCEYWDCCMVHWLIPEICVLSPFAQDIHTLHAFQL